MKTSALLLAPAAVAAQWYGGAPDCAQSCLSSAWNSAVASSAWPAPSEYCDGSNRGATASSCLNAACSATPTAWSSYSSLSSSVCSRYSSCSAAGSTGVYTVSAPTITGGMSGMGGGPWGTRTWTGGVYTVTGCEWDGSPWAGGPGGFGWGPGGMGGAGSPWGDWGHGWTWSTYTKTVVITLMTTNGGAQSTTTSTELATVAEAVSGSVTSTTTLAAAAQATGNAAAAGGVDAGVMVMGALLGGVVAVAGLL